MRNNFVLHLTLQNGVNVFLHARFWGHPLKRGAIIMWISFIFAIFRWSGETLGGVLVYHSFSCSQVDVFSQRPSISDFTY